jgi:glutathione-independent formaldehyde dehydrogenase
VQGGDTAESKAGKLLLDWGTMWSKCCSVATGQTPCLRHMHGLTRAVLSDHLHVAEYLNISTIPLEEAPTAYKNFSTGEARKYVIDPHGSIPRSAKSFLDQRKRKVHDLAQSLQEGA